MATSASPVATRGCVPAIITYINTHDGVLFIVWDEPEASVIQPFVVVGPHVKTNYTSTVAVNHSGYVKTIDEILRLPVLSTVTSATDFFVAGSFPYLKKS